MSEETIVQPPPPPVLSDGAPPPGDPPPAAVAEPAEPPKPQKTPGDIARDAIYANFAAKRAAAGDASEEAMRAGAMEMSGTPPPAAEPAAVAPPPAAAPPPPKKNADTPLANLPETITITVEGREMSVPATEVLRAGVATLQKETAADARLLRAAQAEQAVLERAARLDARTAEIERSRLPEQGAGSQGGDARTLPKGGQPNVTITKDALEALVDGDTATAAERLNKVIAEQVRAATAAPPPQGEGKQPPPAEAQSGPWGKDDVERANRVFLDAFPDIAYNPMALAQASGRMQYEMANPVNRAGKVDLVTIAARIGADLRKSLAPPPPPPPPAANADELAARRTLAARVPGVPTPATPRSVAPPAEPRRQTPSEVVQQMRKARHQA